MTQTGTESLDQNAFMDDQSGVKIIPSFEEMPLHPLLLRGIASYGFEQPSAIQQRAIVPFVEGGDIVAQAPAGTGKTGAFAIGLLARLDFGLKKLQALVLSPSRELAQQISEVISQLGDYLAEHHMFCHTFVGDTRIQNDIRKIEAGVFVAVGTPGRVLDLISRGALRTDFLRTVVLDEANVMLSKSLIGQVSEIFNFFPKDIQVALFTTTMSQEVLDIATKFMRKPTHTQILTKPHTFNNSIKQFYIPVEEENKLDMLMDFYESVAVAQSVVFANTRRKVDHIAETLNQNNHIVSVQHPEMARGEREKALSTFKSGNSRILVTTELFRGIDLNYLNVVINYDLPTANKEDYSRRISCIGRNGRKALAISLVSQRDVSLLREIEEYHHTKIEELPMDFVADLGA